ncbi:LysR family transcriptional regulator [Gilvimarinus sp. 1_MG-2023]|uniref:LysR family transcriptional regulator n=1 Tax=Gilvimarinus sp. 1_MG-2023 TaxID=3062638 RepID=UPI0026E1DC90|nr:LysR family transcriptional regulator [Gilvimarinus sp. 1_MG-2023]MDO6748055.1 LysR family transcriptional regulator [Gilvimarinus sp. 1_MG-2023]
MNIEHLRLFVRVASTHNISQAGEEQNLSPAVASAYINKLEKSLATRLIHRTTRHVSLTEDGEAFLPHAEDVLASVEAAEAAIGRGNHAPSGTLRITAPASFGRMHLMPQMHDFMRAYPNLTIDCRFSDAIVDLVEGGFDIAIRNAELKNSSLIARKLAPDNRILCAAPSYLEEFGIPQTPHELTQHQCLTLTGLDTWRFTGPEGPIALKIKAKLRTDNGEAVRDACVQGIGITINSTWSAYQQLRSGELVHILKDYPLVSNTSLWAVYPSSRQLAPKVRAFIDYFAGLYSGIPYWEQ